MMRLDTGKTGAKAVLGKLLRLGPAACGFTVLFGLWFSVPLYAQNGDGHNVSAASAFFDPFAAPVPFGPGERLSYRMKVGLFNVGTGSFEVTTVDTVRGNPSYHLRMEIEGNIMNAKIHDVFESWLDIYTLSSHRFVQDLDELGDVRHRYYEFYPDEGEYLLVGDPEREPLSTPLPLDDLSFFFYARAVPLEVGREYQLHRYFKESGNPVLLKVLRREQIEVPAGTFNTIVVQPVIRTRGIFGEGGEAEIYFTDDDRRLLVMLKTKGIPILGSLQLQLESIEEGTPIWVGQESPAPNR